MVVCSLAKAGFLRFAFSRSRRTHGEITTSSPRSAVTSHQCAATTCVVTRHISSYTTMPSVTVRPLDLDTHIRGALECSVCLLPYNTTTSKPVQLDPCGHCFCTECASQLQSCPYCRATILQRLPNRGLFDVVTAVDVARNSSAEAAGGLTTPLLVQSSTSDDRQCSCNCLERMGAITLQDMTTMCGSLLTIMWSRLLSLLGGLLGRLLTIVSSPEIMVLSRADNGIFPSRAMVLQYPDAGKINFQSVAVILFHVLVLTGLLIRMRQSSVVQGYLVFYALRIGFCLYRYRYQLWGLSGRNPRRRYPPDTPSYLEYRNSDVIHTRLVYILFYEKASGVMHRVAAFIVSVSALDLHTSIQDNLKWENYWLLVNVATAISLMVCVLLVVLLCATYRSPFYHHHDGFTTGSSLRLQFPFSVIWGSLECRLVAIWSFPSSVWNLLSAALDSFFVYLAFLGTGTGWLIRIGPVSDRCQTSVMSGAQSMSQ